MTTAKKTAAPQETLKQVETMVAASKEAMETMVKTGGDAANKGYEQAVTMTKEQIAKQSEAFFKSYDGLAELNRANLDAVNTSGAIMTKGVEEIGKAWFGFTQSNLEQAAGTMQALMGCKTLRDVMELQNGFAKTSFDQTIAETAKLSEMSVKVANDAVEPIKARVNSSVEFFLKPVAA